MTDDSETYQKMCQTTGLEWEPRLEDRTNIGIVVGLGSNLGATTLYILPYGKEYNAITARSRKSLTPLFSIEQLMEMVVKRGPMADNDFKPFSDLVWGNDGVEDWLRTTSGNPYIWIDWDAVNMKYPTTEQLWLAFVMHKLHGKLWNQGALKWG